MAAAIASIIGTLYVLPIPKLVWLSVPFFLLSVLFILSLINYLRLRKYPIAVLFNKVTLELKDTSGHLVSLKKEQKIRANHHGVNQLLEKVWAEGSINNFQSSIEGGESKLVDLGCEAGEIRKGHCFLPPLKKGKVYLRTFGFDFIDSFTNKDECLSHELLYPSKEIRIEIIFPRGRPPLNAHFSLSRGVVCFFNNPPTIEELPDGRKKAFCSEKNPEVGDKYTIRWNW